MVPEIELATEPGRGGDTPSSDGDRPTMEISPPASGATEPTSDLDWKADPVGYLTEWDPRL